MTENQKSWVFAVAMAMVFVAVSCSFVGVGSAALHHEVFVGVPAGYFDGVMPLGSVDVGSGVSVATVTWDDDTYDFSFTTVPANGRFQRPIYYYSFVQLGSGSVSQSAYDTAPYKFGGTGEPETFNYIVNNLPSTMNLGPGTISCYACNNYYGSGWDPFVLFTFTIPGASTPTPTPTPTTPTPTPTADLMPEIQSFDVFPTLAYQYVYLDCDLVGLRGTSASVAGDAATALTWNSTSSSWQGTISFSAPGDYTVHGVLTNAYGTVSSSNVLIHIYELPDVPVINDVSVDYDLGGYHPRLTMSVTFPAGVNADPDNAIGVSWGDGDYTYYDGWANLPDIPTYGSPVVVQMDHVYQAEGYYTATVQVTNADGQNTQDVGIYVSELPPTPTPTTPEPTPTTPEPTTTTPEPTTTTPEPTTTTPTPTATTPAPTGTYPTPTYTIPTPITTVVIPTYDLDPYNPLGLGIASPGGEPPAPPAFPALVLPNLNILEGWGQNTSWSGLYTWYDGVVGSIVDPLGSAWADLMAPLVQYVVDVSAGVTSLFVAVSTWIYPAIAFAWEISAYIYALVPLVVWICIAATLWILVLALLVRLLSEPVWMIIRDLFGGRR